MNTEFREAAIFGEIEKLESFLESSPELVNETDKYGFTALHEAVIEHSLEVIQILISSGANVNAKNDQGIAPMHLVAYEYIADALLKAGADIEIRENGGGTPLHIHSENPESYEIMEFLLKNGADVDAKDNQGATALDTAISRKEEDKIDLLRRFKNT